MHENVLVKCPFCLYAGVEYGKFLIHMNVHFKIRNFKCTVCDDRFYDRSSVNKHEEALHEKDETKYSCKKCDFQTYGQQILYNHLKNKH
jgi:hypothetical protein